MVPKRQNSRINTARAATRSWMPAECTITASDVLAVECRSIERHLPSLVYRQPQVVQRSHRARSRRILRDALQNVRQGIHNTLAGKRSSVLPYLPPYSRDGRVVGGCEARKSALERAVVRRDGNAIGLRAGIQQSDGQPRRDRDLARTTGHFRAGSIHLIGGRRARGEGAQQVGGAARELDGIGIQRSARYDQAVIRTGCGPEVDDGGLHARGGAVDSGGESFERGVR